MTAWRVLGPAVANLSLFSLPGDAHTQKLTRSYEMGSTIQAQQNGAVWASENKIISVGLDGVLNVLDPREGKSRKIHVGLLLPLSICSSQVVDDRLSGSGCFKSYHSLGVLATRQDLLYRLL